MNTAVSCPECGQSVTAGATTCPHCGFPLQEKAKSVTVRESAPGTVYGSAASAVSPGAIRLWNPNAASVWSLFLTPAFGAYLHALNWRALGNPTRAAVNMRWVWATVLFYGLYVILRRLHLSDTVFTVMNWIGFIMLLVWNGQQAIPQGKYVKEALQDRYQKRSWGGPVLSGIVVLFLLGCLMTVSASRLSSEELATRIEPMIMEQWQKNPSLNGIAISKITLVHKEGNNYSGLVEATLAGTSHNLVLDVTYDGQTILWQLKQPGN